jgi:hypothetical protein
MLYIVYMVQSKLSKQKHQYANLKLKGTSNAVKLTPKQLTKLRVNNDLK